MLDGGWRITLPSAAGRHTALPIANPQRLPAAGPCWPPHESGDVLISDLPMPMAAQELLAVPVSGAHLSMGSTNGARKPPALAENGSAPDPTPRTLEDLPRHDIPLYPRLCSTITPNSLIPSSCCAMPNRQAMSRLLPGPSIPLQLVYSECLAQRCKRGMPSTASLPAFRPPDR
jgi:hypothetical protein